MALPTGQEWRLPEAYIPHVHRAARNKEKPLWAPSVRTISPTPPQSERASSEAFGKSLSHMEKGVNVAKEHDNETRRDPGLSRSEHSTVGTSRKRNRTDEEANSSAKKMNKSSTKAVWLRLRVRPEHEVDEDGFLVEPVVHCRTQMASRPKENDKATTKEKVDMDGRVEGCEKWKAEGTISANDEKLRVSALARQKPSVPVQKRPTRMGNPRSQEKRSTKSGGRRSITADAGKGCGGTKQRSSAATNAPDSGRTRTFSGKRQKPSSRDGDTGTTRSSCSRSKKRKNVPKLRKVTHEISAAEWENLIVLKDPNRKGL